MLTVGMAENICKLCITMVTDHLKVGRVHSCGASGQHATVELMDRPQEARYVGPLGTSSLLAASEPCAGTLFNLIPEGFVKENLIPYTG